jgi:hypothetical protein
VAGPARDGHAARRSRRPGDPLRRAQANAAWGFNPIAKLTGYAVRARRGSTRASPRTRRAGTRGRRGQLSISSVRIPASELLERMQAWNLPRARGASHARPSAPRPGARHHARLRVRRTTTRAGALHKFAKSYRRALESARQPWCASRSRSAASRRPPRWPSSRGGCCRREAGCQARTPCRSIAAGRDLRGSRVRTDSTESQFPTEYTGLDTWPRTAVPESRASHWTPAAP